MQWGPKWVMVIGQLHIHVQGIVMGSMRTHLDAISAWVLHITPLCIVHLCMLKCSSGACPLSMIRGVFMSCMPQYRTYCSPIKIWTCFPMGGNQSFNSPSNYKPLLANQRSPTRYPCHVIVPLHVVRTASFQCAIVIVHYE